LSDQRKIPEILNMPSGPISQKWLDAFVKELKTKWNYMAQTVNRSLTLYIDAAEPDIPVNSTSLWFDTINVKYYLIANFGGSQKKVELI
jgi:hypothetical protein